MLKLVAPQQCTKEEKAEAIETSRWLRGVPWEDVVRIAAYMNMYELSPGLEITKEGSDDAFMGVVIDGTVVVMKVDSSGIEKKIAEVGKGKTFGEMSLLDRAPRSATIVTETKATLVTLTREIFERIMADNPALAVIILRHIAQLLSQRLRRTSGLLADFLDQEPEFGE